MYECAWYHNTFPVHLSLGNKVVLYCNSVFLATFSSDPYPNILLANKQINTLSISHQINPPSKLCVHWLVTVCSSWDKLCSRQDPEIQLLLSPFHLVSPLSISSPVFLVTKIPLFPLAVVYHRSEIQVASADGGLFLACENLERTFDHSWTACAFFSFSFFEVEVSLRTIIPHFNARISPQWLSWPRWLWLNVPHKLRVSSFLDRFPHYAWTVA